MIILTLLILVWGGLNLAKFAIYSEYYGIKSNLCDNPGLNDGFVCQGIGVAEADGKILVSGYMTDNTASRIYITDENDNSYYITLNKNNEKFTEHAGGIAISDDIVYIASEGTLYTLSLNQILGSKNGDSVEIGNGVAVNNSASFVFADDNYVYVGEFHNGDKYITNHPYETADGKYYAIVSRYSHDNLNEPNRIYSIRNKVQGICFTPDGKVVLSTSYGLADSVYYVYNESDVTESGLTLDGAPVYYLDNCTSEIKGPAMAEGLAYRDGKVITLTESASNKYIFGKFFFANKIVELEF